MIYIVSQYYPPVGNPPSNRMEHLVRTLLKKYPSDEIRVITGRPNYPDGVLPTDLKWRIYKKKTGELGESIECLYEIPAPFKGFFLKTLGLLSFALSVFIYFLFKRLKKDDLLFITSGPVFPVYAICFLSKFKKNLRYVLDIRDLWPQTVAGLGYLREGTHIYKYLIKLSDRAHRSAVASIGVVEGICDYIKKVAPDRPVNLIYNPVDVKRFKPLDEKDVMIFRKNHPEVFGDSKKTVFLYAGVHSNAMDLPSLMRALEILYKKTDQFIFIFIGYGEQKAEMQKFVINHKLSDNVIFLPFMSRDKLRDYICSVDFCYSSTSAKPIYRMVIPTKMCEYMSCNKFVVAVHDCPFASRVAEEGNAVVCPPGNHIEIAKTLSDLINDREATSMQLTSREYIIKNHSEACFDERMLRFFSDIYDKKINSDGCRF